MLNRRNFVKKLATVPLVGAALVVPTKAKNLIKCDVCHLDTPNSLVSVRPDGKYPDFGSYNTNWWEDLFGPNLSVICILCVNHKICYPYFERVVFTKPAKGQVWAEYASSPFYENLWKAKHDCSIVDLEKELQEYRIAQLK